MPFKCRVLCICKKRQKNQTKNPNANNTGTHPPAISSGAEKKGTPTNQVPAGSWTSVLFWSGRKGADQADSRIKFALGRRSVSEERQKQRSQLRLSEQVPCKAEGKKLLIQPAKTGTYTPQCPSLALFYCCPTECSCGRGGLVVRQKHRHDPQLTAFQMLNKPVSNLTIQAAAPAEPDRDSPCSGGF